MNKETIKAGAWGLVLTLIVASLIVLGSRNLAHFDAALVGYTFAVLFATFGITYRYTMWLQRPPTAIYWKRGWKVFFGLFRPRYGKRNLAQFLRRIVADLAINRFIWRRGKLRWAAHWLTMWGCLIASAIT